MPPKRPLRKPFRWERIERCPAVLTPKRLELVVAFTARPPARRKMQSSHRQKNQTGPMPRTVSYLEITETVTLISDTPRILTFVPDTRRMKSSSP
jgi:hypothetical protein